MYLAIDIGGTKTLLAVFDENGKIISEQKFNSNPDYNQWKLDLTDQIAHIKHQNITYCCVAVPALIDRKNGVATYFGRLPWQNTPIASDVSAVLSGIPVVIENDANLAGLSEAIAVTNTYRKVLYITISTGIGDGIIVDGKIDPILADSEPGQMVIEHNGVLDKWENFASGKAIKDKYGKLAADIEDPQIWRQFAKDFALGLAELLAIIHPDVVIIGGGVGTHFAKYGQMLSEETQVLANNMINVPPIIQAKRPEEAVIYGCYEFIKQQV